MNRILQTIILCLAFTYSYADIVQVDGINYKTNDDGTATVLPNNYDENTGGMVIIGLNNGYPGDVVIPETITDNEVTYTVTSAYEGTFSNATKMTTISLPATLISLGDTPFASCNKLTSITVSPDNPVYSSEDGVLYNKAKSVLISCPGGKTGSFAVPESVTSIANSAFYGCSKLNSIQLPSSLQDIGTNAFRACLIMTEINIPEGIKVLEEGVFRGCSALKKAIIPSSVTKINDYAFYYCQSLNEVQILGPVTSIGSYAFSSCVKLPSIQLPSTLLTMGDRVFDSTSRIASITLPASLRSIGIANFRACTNLISIDIDKSNQFFCCENGVLYDKQKEKIICCPPRKQGIFIIPETVKTIDSYAFFMCRYLTDIKLPVSLYEIGSSAFANCSNLTTLTLPNALRRIGKSAFIACNALQSITSYSIVPPVNTPNVFSTTTYELPLYVPSAAIASYQNSDEWENFTNIIPVTDMMTANVKNAFTNAVTCVDINICNAQTNVSGYTMELQLPEGMSLVYDENGDPICNFTNRLRNSQPSLTINGTAETGYTITVSNDEKMVVGNEGDVMSLMVSVSKDVEPDNTYTGTISSCSITYADGTTSNSADNSFDINVESARLGDCNRSGEINVVDVMLTVDQILGINVTNYFWQLSDMNRDGYITVVDVMEIVNIILGIM